MDQYIGKMLDNRYEILECIGTGGMAVVYKARDHRLNRLVAVKILKPELASDAEFRRRFHDESQAVAMLSHANIVSVYDVSHSDGLNYIVMELIDGLTLKQYMQRRGTPLNWREAQHFITQIMRALSHAHGRGIIHRDIKPHNIMVLRDGSVKVTDFGIARLASAAQSTMTQEAIGSVHYISPEQAKGSHVDCRTDIYSAGVVLYEMITGRLPFEGDTPVAVAIQHIKSIPVPPCDLNPDIPKGLEAITLKAMSPDLAQRYASAEEMLDDLKEFRKNPDFEPAVVDPEEDPDEPTMVVPTKVITASVRVPVEREQRREPERPPQPERRERRREEDYDDYDYDDEPPRRGGSVAAVVVAIALILVLIGGIGYFLWNFIGKELLNPQAQEYEVPNLLGHTLEELRQKPELLDGFELVEGSVVFSEEYPEDQVCEQDPAPGEMVKEGGKSITVSISGGKDEMYMPDVYNHDVREVLKILQDDMGLRVTDQQREFDDEITEGFVISSTPVANTRVEKGQEVSIVISKGPEIEKSTVTRFINLTIEDAKLQIKQLGLVAKVTEHYSDEYEVGRVSFQNIEQGTQVPKGTVIELWVSLGPEPEPSAEPSPSDEVPGSEPPASDQLPDPTQDVAAPSTTKTINVDLSEYEGSVELRVVVGDVEVFKGTVDANQSLTKSIPVTGSGTQVAYIYINSSLVRSIPVDFSQP